MRKYTRSLTVLFVSAIAVFASCNKESDNGSNPPVSDTTTTKLILSNMFAGTRTMTATQTHEVNAGTQRILFGNRGTRFVFYPNSFKDKNGNIITTGQIDIKLVEMYRPGEVIANRSSTVSAGRLLRSAGQVYVKAYRAGVEVFPTKFGIGFPLSNTGMGAPMALYYGNNLNSDSIVNWTQAAANIGTFVNGAFLDTNNSQLYYQFDSCTNFNWLNCDYPHDITGTQMVNLSLVSKDTFDLDHTNTRVFLVFPTINSVTYMQKYTDTAKTWALSEPFLVPANMNFHAISISLKNGLYYYSELKNQVTKYGYVDTLRPEQKTLPDVLTALGIL